MKTTRLQARESVADKVVAQRGIRASCKTTVCCSCRQRAKSARANYTKLQEWRFLYVWARSSREQHVKKPDGKTTTLKKKKWVNPWVGPFEDIGEEAEWIKENPQAGLIKEISIGESLK